jgi:hypothetical protein
MNVENRKLFANRDARKRLAEMGGILASSPELMGEAMKFANGGTARERAISGQGALDQFASSGMQPLDFSFRDLDRDLGSEMQALDDRVQGRIVSFLGNLFEVVGDKIFHTESGVEIEEPNLKAEILTQGDRIAGEDMAMAVPFPQGQARNYTQLVSDIENPIERGRALLAASSPEVELENAPITSMNRPAGEVMFPGELSRAFVPEPRGAEELMAGPIYPAEERSFNGPEQKLLNAMNPAFDSFGGDLLARNSDAKDLMAGPIYPAEERSSDTSTNLALLSDSRLEAERLSRKSIVPNFVMDVIDNLQTVPGTVGAGAADVVGSTLAALGATDAGAKFLESAKNKRDLIATIKAAEKERESETVADVAEVVAEQARRDPTGPMSEIDDGTGTDFSLVPKETIAKAVETNDPKAASAALMKSITGVDVHGGTTPPPSDDTPDAPKPDAPKTRKQRMLESVDMISELFGIREKDKAEDMYDLMATIGFAMASGESPNAMKNIADAFLVGAQMKRADKKEDKKLDQAIRTLAVKDVLEQESDERALKRLLAKEERAKTQALELYVQKLEAAEDFEDPESIFANEPYKSMAIIARQDPPNTDPDQTVIERLTAGGFNPAAINAFIKAMQLSTEAGAGAGVTPGQVQSLKDIPDGTK